MPRAAQVTHGFSVGEVVRRNIGGGAWELAQSDALSIIRGVVDQIEDDDLFSFQTEGRVRLAAHGLTVGSVYYIDPATPGAVVTPQSTTGQQDPIFYVPDADNVVVFASKGGALTYRRSFVNADLSADVLTVTHNLNKQYAHVTVYRNTTVALGSSQFILTATGVDALTVDLTGLTPITGTWNLIVSA